MLEHVVAQIKPLDEAAMAKCKIRLDNLTKPLASLHAFEHLACKMAGITRRPRPQKTDSAIVLMNGSRRTVGLSDTFAAQVSARLICFDVGKVEQPTTEDLLQVVLKGVGIACEATAQGAQAIGTGSVGDPDPAVLERIIAQVRGGVDGMAIINAAGNLEVAGLVGVMLGAASTGSAIVLDGTLTSAAALVACQIAPALHEYLVGSHFSTEPHQAEILELLNLPAYLYLGMNVGEAVAAALGISLIQASLHVLNDMKTFGEAEVSVAEDGPGALVQNRNVRD
jgi:nicotinate-nucleotide--dimethylbenzimidazole phosphoribosyltransferase